MSQGTFAELGVPGELVEILDRRLITEPFEIQALAIPDALVGRDILGRAPTGSGKTLAFGLPMLARLQPGAKKRPRGLILSPTRELAEQICRELEPLAKAMDRSVLAVYGGTGLDRQIRALRKGVDVLVACPGRLIDLIEQKAVMLADVDIAVVDEADRMADMGFLPDVRKLLDQTAEDRQTVLFSATLDRDVQVLIDNYQHDPVVHEVGEVEPDLTLVDHRFIKVKKTDRIWLAADVIADAGPTVVFVRTRHGVDRLARQLKQEGIKAGYIHGGRTQSQRDRALQVFIQGKVEALVATDVAARGIHVDGVACVIHYDPPAEIKDYVHRSGRTARAGANGTVVSFLDPPQVKESQKMQRKLGIETELEPLPARKPRDSRPATVDDRRSDSAGSRARKSSGAKTSRSKPKGHKARNSTRQDENRSEKRNGKPRSADRRSASRSTPAKAAVGAKASKPSKARAGAKADEVETASGSESSPRHSGARKTNGRPSAGRPSAGKAKAKPRSAGKRSSSSGSKPASGARRSKPSTGDARPAGKKRSSKANGAKASTPKPKSKRSGKPRPKNRKNKPKAGGRR